MNPSSTCDRVELASLQDDGEHEDQLGGALRERLYQPQHAEVVAQEDGVVAMGTLLLGTEALDGCLHHTGMSERMKQRDRRRMKAPNCNVGLTNQSQQEEEEEEEVGVASSAALPIKPATCVGGSPHWIYVPLMTNTSNI